jgi:hypothetical protein
MCKAESCTTAAGFVSRTVKRVASEHTKIKAVVEVESITLDQKCTAVHLAPEGQVCLVYVEEGGCLHANVRDVEGVEVPDVRNEHRPPNHPFYPSRDLARHRREDIFKPLTYLGPASKALRSHPRVPDGRIESLGRGGTEALNVGHPAAAEGPDDQQPRCSCGAGWEGSKAMARPAVLALSAPPTTQPTSRTSPGPWQWHGLSSRTVRAREV